MPVHNEFVFCVLCRLFLFPLKLNFVILLKGGPLIPLVTSKRGRFMWVLFWYQVLRAVFLFVIISFYETSLEYIWTLLIIIIMDFTLSFFTTNSYTLFTLLWKICLSFMIRSFFIVLSYSFCTRSTIYNIQQQQTISWSYDA